jgi:hypothetical protein
MAAECELGMLEHCGNENAYRNYEFFLLTHMFVSVSGGEFARDELAEGLV